MSESPKPSLPYRYEVSEQRLPDELNAKTRNFLAHLSDTFYPHRETVLEVVAYSGVRWEYKPSSIELYSLAQYENVFAYLDRMSRILAPIYREHRILPIVRPVTIEQVLDSADLFRVQNARLSRRGILAFVSGYAL